tara:strand:+ start:157 stop:1443 length:1287 start_codon:yes stop_codon:yes gene_type:complete
MGRSIYTIEDINSELDFAPNAFVALDYSGAPTVFQLEQEIVADLHTNQFQEIGCHVCGNVDMFTRELNNKGRRYRCGYCLYNSESEFETVKSKKDITLSSFGLDYVCDICGEVMDSYNRGTIIKHLQKHEDANKVSEAEGSDNPIDINQYVEELDLYAALNENHDTHSCFDFAEMLHSNLTDDNIEAEIQAPKNDTTVHRWVYVPANNKHYDAYSLYYDGDGEEDWRNLAYWDELADVDWHEAFITPQSQSVRISFASETTDSEIRQWLKVLRDTDPDWEEIDWEKPSDKPDPDWGIEWEAERRIVKGMRKCDVCSMPARPNEELCQNCWTEYLSATYANNNWKEHQHQEAIAILNWMCKPADKPKEPMACPRCNSDELEHSYDDWPDDEMENKNDIRRHYSCGSCSAVWVESWIYDSLLIVKRGTNS